MRRFLFVVVASFAVVSGASAAPVNSHQVAFLDATCTGLGSVTLVNTGPAHTEALQVLGTNTVVLVPFNGAPGGLIDREEGPRGWGLSHARVHSGTLAQAGD